MAITETNLPGGKWERTYTGSDVAASKGELNQWGREQFEKSWRKNVQTGFERINDPHGNPTYVHSDKVSEYRALGYGATVAPSMMVPDLPWAKKPITPGRHKYKYVDGEIVEV